MKKSKIILGSSNLHRHFGRAEREKGYSVIKCTNWEIFCVRLACLEEIDKAIVVSVFENFICDDAKDILWFNGLFCPFIFYSCNYKEKTNNNQRCFIQPGLMPFGLSYCYSLLNKNCALFR